MEKGLRLIAIVLGPVIIVFYAYSFYKDPELVVLCGKFLLLGLAIGLPITLVYFVYLVVKARAGRK